MVTDVDGKQTIVIKGGGNQGNTGRIFYFSYLTLSKCIIIGDTNFELITDASGRTIIKIKKKQSSTRMKIYFNSKFNF